MSNPAKYSLPMRLMHWAMAALILGLIAVGWYMEGLDRSVEAKFAVFYPLHKSFGALVLLLVLMRVVMKAFTAKPAMPSYVNGIMRKLSVASHHLLYMLMLAIPLSGYLMSNAGGRAVEMFGITLPVLVEKNKALGSLMHDIHVTAPYVLLALIAVHIGAAIKHHWFDDSERSYLRRMA
ncbi:cytochrome b [Microbulbifer flavimaris]|uniref:Cytochrome b n=1 Tax=Microbulbifer flavimaris TaxID=1781068 RepID=A0ABX4I0C5_9GAMM|nr:MULTISPECIES: cytochrome b [Microbulbifer]KUJ82838.1 hypothetical protein AVO43_09735 [Microbulbifer sp. ZGT114]PCO05014.1 cytochrome b [Microbulbifer flavimaris]